MLAGESQGPIFGRDDNPFLAGGIEAPPREYMQFMDALNAGELISQNMMDQMFSDNYPDADKGGLFAIASSRYGSTNWYECPQFISSRPGEFDDECKEAHIHTSPGAAGTYPIIDLKNGYHLYLGYSGVLGWVLLYLVSIVIFLSLLLMMLSPVLCLHTQLK